MQFNELQDSSLLTGNRVSCSLLACQLLRYVDIFDREKFRSFNLEPRLALRKRCKADARYRVKPLYSVSLLEKSTEQKKR